MTVADAGPYLSDDEFDALSPEAQAEYLALLRIGATAWELTPVQLRAEAAAAEADETLFGGSAGGGKTDWMLFHAYHLSLQHPGHQTLIIRRTFPMLRRSAIRRSLEVFDPADGCRWRAGDKEWRFENGSIIEFGYCEQEDDVHQYLSAQYDLICVDEATELTEYQWVMLRSRCRTRADKRRRGVRPHMVACSNPGRVSHRYFKERFVDEASEPDSNRRVVSIDRRTETLGTTRYERVTRIDSEEIILDQNGSPITGDDGELVVNRLAFVPALVSDNPHQDQAYIHNLLQLPDTERRMYLLGDWDVFKGQFFTEWDRSMHLIAPFDIPAEWPRFRGYDHGLRDPACMAWYAVDPEGFIVCYRELWRTDTVVRDLASDMNRQSGQEKIRYTMASPDIFRETGGKGGTIAQEFRKQQVPMRPANNDRLSGHSRVRDFLKVQDGVRAPWWADGHKGQGEDDRESWRSPGIFFFGTLSWCIKALPAMIHDDTKPEDMGKHKLDHWPDQLRYALMSRPPPATATGPRKSAVEDLWERVWRQVGRGVRTPAVVGE